MLVSNNSQRNISIELVVNGKSWICILPSFSTEVIPSYDHYLALLPYIEQFNLTLYEVVDEPKIEPAEIGLFPRYFGPQTENRNPAFAPPKVVASMEKMNEYPGYYGMCDEKMAVVDALSFYHERERETKEQELRSYEESLRLRTKAQLKDLCIDEEVETGTANKEELIQRLLRKKDD